MSEQQQPTGWNSWSKRKKAGVILLGAFIVIFVIPSILSVANRPTTPAGPAPTPVGHVSQAMLGDRWPLTVSEGTLSCVGGGAVIFREPNGRGYAVNGLATSRFPDLPDIAEIWADNPDPATRDVAPKKNIGPLIDRGLALC